MKKFVFAGLLLRVLRPLLRKEQVGEITILDLTIDQSALTTYQPVAKALRFIAQNDTRRFDALRHLTPRIGIADLDGSDGEYWAHFGGSILRRNFVNKGDFKAISMVIIHEMTHARIHKWGVQEGEIERLEAACLKEELRFAHRASLGSEYYAWARRRACSDIIVNPEARKQMMRNRIDNLPVGRSLKAVIRYFNSR